MDVLATWPEFDFTGPKWPLISRDIILRVVLHVSATKVCDGEVGNVLVITDHFTRYAIAAPSKNQTVKSRLQRAP